MPAAVDAATVVRRAEVADALRGRPFTVDEAARVGVDRTALRRVGYRRLFPLVYIAACTPTSHTVLVRAALLAWPRTFAVGRSAAVVWGVPLPAPDVVHLGVPAEQARVQAAGVACARVKRPDVVEWRGQRLTTAARTFTDLAQDLWFAPLVEAGDALVRRGAVRPAELVTAAAAARGRHARAARRAAALVRAGSDSGPETRTRLLAHLAGLPEPCLNVDVHRDGGWVARPDLSWPAYRVCVEYDGDHHRTDRRQWASDLARRENLEDAGWVVVVLTATDLFRRPGPSLMRIVRALQRRGWDGFDGLLPTAWTDVFAPGAADR